MLLTFTLNRGDLCTVDERLRCYSIIIESMCTKCIYMHMLNKCMCDVCAR